MMKIAPIIKNLQELERRGHTEIIIHISDGYDSVETEGLHFNEIVCEDGTKMADLEIAYPN